MSIIRPQILHTVNPWDRMGSISGKKQKGISKKAAGALLAFTLCVPGAFAKEVSYDRYAAVYSKTPAAPSTLREVSTGLLTYPLEPLRYLASKSLLAIEKHHLDDKTLWALDTLHDHGISPKTGTVSLTQGIMGVDVDFIKLARLKPVLPDVVLQGNVANVRDLLFKTGARVGADRIAGTGLYFYGDAGYEYRPQEFFYGIGPHASRGDGGIYSYEETAVGPMLGYQWADDLKMDYKLQYRNINVGEGHRSGRLQARDLGPAGSLLGGFGDKLLSQEARVAYDTRNHQEHSDRGGLHTLAVSYHEGLEESKARFLHYEAELSRYQSLGSPRRVLAAHFYGEQNERVNGGYVPFHQMAKLGGYGTTYYQSHTLRAYGPNRFFDTSSMLFNLEYRYNIWQYREIRLDTVAFFEEGQVFSEFSRFKLRDFRESYGGGVRVSIAHLPIMSIESAHGDEGTHFYVKSEMPF